MNMNFKQTHRGNYSPGRTQPIEYIDLYAPFIDAIAFDAELNMTSSFALVVDSVFKWSAHPKFSARNVIDNIIYTNFFIIFSIKS